MRRFPFGVVRETNDGCPFPPVGDTHVSTCAVNVWASSISQILRVNAHTVGKYANMGTGQGRVVVAKSGCQRLDRVWLGLGGESSVGIRDPDPTPPSRLLPRPRPHVWPRLEERRS